MDGSGFEAWGGLIVGIKLGGGVLRAGVKAGGGSSEDGDTIDYNQPPLFPIFYNQPSFSPSLMLSKLIVLFTCKFQSMFYELETCCVIKHCAKKVLDEILRAID